MEEVRVCGLGPDSTETPRRVSGPLWHGTLSRLVGLEILQDILSNSELIPAAFGKKIGDQVNQDPFESSVNRLDALFALFPLEYLSRDDYVFFGDPER